MLCISIFISHGGPQLNSLVEPSDQPRTGAPWTLAAQSDHTALQQLQAFLSVNRQHPVWIEAGGLRRPDTLLLQLLVAACRDWVARGLPFRLTGVPDRILSLLPLLGLQPDMIGAEAH